MSRWEGDGVPITRRGAVAIVGSVSVAGVAVFVTGVSSDDPDASLAGGREADGQDERAPADTQQSDFDGDSTPTGFGHGGFGRGAYGS